MLLEMQCNTNLAARHHEHSAMALWAPEPLASFGSHSCPRRRGFSTQACPVIVGREKRTKMMVPHVVPCKGG